MGLFLWTRLINFIFMRYDMGGGGLVHIPEYSIDLIILKFENVPRLKPGVR
jgi:hypothetical protein